LCLLWLGLGWVKRLGFVVGVLCRLVFDMRVVCSVVALFGWVLGWFLFGGGGVFGYIGIL
jgi:hypothetical protein